VHPFNVLTALKTYSGGHGFRGSLSWTPVQRIVDALDAAFYLAFKNVEPTGKRVNIALDISGSMGTRLMDSNVTAREASVAMAMATLAGDPDTTVATAFTSGSASWAVPGMRQRFAGYPSGITEVGLSTRRRLDDIVRETVNMRMGGTDCALPMLWALETNQVFDAFVIYTDNETWAGSVQPMDALRAYRHTVNPEARLIVVGMTSTGFSIADPQDKGALDVTGFDASAPAVISNFIAGKF
jgi:60 kDa SS-A/Ro ribonucleoprotein